MKFGSSLKFGSSFPPRDAGRSPGRWRALEEASAVQRTHPLLGCDLTGVTLWGLAMAVTSVLTRDPDLLHLDQSALRFETTYLDRQRGVADRLDLEPVAVGVDEPSNFDSRGVEPRTKNVRIAGLGRNPPHSSSCGGMD
jgi:hypothetical protein